MNPDKIASELYSSPAEFVDDVLLMLNNCRLYNGPDSEYTETADELEDLFKDKMKMSLPQLWFVNNELKSFLVITDSCII